MSDEKIKISLPWLWPAVRPCSAKTRAGTPCKNWAMKNGRCKFHGGKSTGAKTLAGRIKSSMSNFKTGQHSFELQKQRLIIRLTKALAIKNGKPLLPDAAQSLTAQIGQMSFAEFKNVKEKLHNFITKIETTGQNY